MATEERHADFALERLDLCAHGGGRDAELVGGSGKAQMGGDGLEDLECVERQAFEVSRHVGPACTGRVNNTKTRCVTQAQSHASRARLGRKAMRTVASRRARM